MLPTAMKNMFGVLLALWVSFIVVMIPRGMRPAIPEFWLTPWLYGAPVLVLGWPMYLQIFKRLPQAAWWKLSIIGLLLCPIPFFLLIVGSSAIRGEFPVGRPSATTSLGIASLRIGTLSSASCSEHGWG